MRYTGHHKTAEIAKLPRGMIAGSALALVLVLAGLIATAPQPSTRKALPEFSLAKPVQASSRPAAAVTDNKPLRLVYRNSVVPGGVHSAAELAAVIKRDPIAAAHYALFDVAKAHLVRVEQSRLVHVSYRIGNQIYWTKNKVRLALGESLLSDGTHLIRARCGNRIADSVQGPVLLNEPAPEVLETAFVSADDLIDQTVSMAALGGLPLQADLPNATVASAVDATPSRSREWQHFGMPALVSIPTLPGVTVVGGRTAPALLVDGVVSAAVATVPATTGPAVPAAAEPVTAPSSSLFPVLDSLPKGDTATAPIDVQTALPVSDSPAAPFIEAPTFTPAQQIIATPLTNASVPEPGGALLAAMALAMLVAARSLRRRKT